MPSVSVVICAYTEDRWSTIVRGAASAVGGSLAPDELILVIDHNRALFERAKRHFGDVATVVENSRRRGLSGARNTGVDVARGEIVAFLDDDAVADADWLELLIAQYVDDSIVAVGGSARPAWPASRPPMYPTPGSALDPTAGPGEFDWVVGCTYLGQPTSASEVRNLMGCNMSLRRAAIVTAGGFGEELGRVGRIPLGGEETELCIRITAANPQATVIFEPSSAVSHEVAAARGTWGYFLRRCYAEGLSKASIARLQGATAALSTEKDYVVRVLGRGVLRELRAGRFQGAAAIVAGLGITGVGYVRGRLARSTSSNAHRVFEPAAAQA
ncbi:glycosyltransferase involved in cell wall biosynthesis [Pseudoclavibacter sp. JAI123]|uniref:glycosyltransferase family 2 protein n=1 Tax=Pseudoclavibacter sp. JAI123 TaxID=2723065 RepID=UPI0015C9872B|nr:glycosyltransferase [Pseudoclavibacter sp. JAI123]NYF12806.1 glycosyltransferase involved in cell wall biosynthesis [Pseudoclavibacter sp. JAI123]